ncbi:MAG TPA: hypothetical protein VF219_15800 [Vicinamibacterales bacterium]
MSRIVRRDMLKVMAATAAGAAAGRTGIESVLAASPAPDSGTVIGTPASVATSAPRGLATTPFTTYQGFPGSDFDAAASTYTWNVVTNTKVATNGGTYLRRFLVPQATVLTECLFYVVNPTMNVSCYMLRGNLGTNAPTIFGSATTSAPSATVQTLALVMTPTFVDNASFWYQLAFIAGGATDDQIVGARIGWLNNPGLTLFPDPRRIVSTNMVSGSTYGPIDATLKSDLVTPSGIPAGATAAFCAVQSYTPGVLTIFPDGTIDPAIANYSGTGNQGSSLNMLYMMVPLSPAGKFKIHSYITGGVYLDAWGYVV